MTTDIVTYSSADVEVIKATHFKGLSDDQIQYALKKAERMKLDFFAGQVQAWPGRSGKVEVYTTIQGLRAKAEETGLFFPGREATFAHDEKGQLVSATSYVMRWDSRSEAWVERSETSLMQEYAGNTGAWQTHRHVMLAKTAEARCIRRVFPMLHDMYIAEERQEENHSADRDVARAAKIAKIATIDPKTEIVLPERLPLNATPDVPYPVPPLSVFKETSPLTPRENLISELSAVLSTLSRPKRIVLFKRLGMDDPKDLTVLTDEDLGNILDAAGAK